jgi:prefoldin subunit 5
LRSAEEQLEKVGASLEEERQQSSRLAEELENQQQAYGALDEERASLLSSLEQLRSVESGMTRLFSVGVSGDTDY